MLFMQGTAGGEAVDAIGARLIEETRFRIFVKDAAGGDPAAGLPLPFDAEFTLADFEEVCGVADVVNYARVNLAHRNK